MSSDRLRIILLRHGQTVYNTEKRLQSSKDSLTDSGKQQIRDLVEKLPVFDQIISSDEKRALESAEIISSLTDKNFEIMPLIHEKSSGDFSDKLVSEVDWSLVKGTFLDKKIPGGESVRDLMVRALDFFKKINEFEQGKNILVVSHGTFLRVLLCLVLNTNVQDCLLNYEFPNATYLVLSRSEEGMWGLEQSSLVKIEKH